MKILFVCKGNIGRSQIAEGLFNSLTDGKHVATSAGLTVTKDDSNNEGQKIIDRDENIITVMKEIGLDVSKNVRNQLTPEMLGSADRVVVMAPPEVIPEYLKQSRKVVFWDVPDPADLPWGHIRLEFTRDVRRQLEVLTNNLYKTLG
jgi:arsenate reductase